jgi:parallel beta-helix repeat protein
MAMQKKTYSIAIITSALLILAVVAVENIDLAYGNFFPDPGPDLPRIYIRNDGTIDPATAPITRTGNLYKLTNNIVLYTIEIQRDNIIFDGSNCVIFGNESWLGTTPHFNDFGNNGLLIEGQNNITVTSLNIEKYSAGIRISNSSQIKIISSRFINESAPMGTPAGIVIKDSSQILIENNNFNSQGQAIVLNGTNCMIINNTLIRGGIDLSGTSNLISENTIQANSPITMDIADSNVIAGNKITGPSTSPNVSAQERTGAEGIAFFRNCSDNLISGNNITGFVGQAIRTVWSSSNNTFFGNYFANNGFAIVFQDGAVNNRLYGNAFAADSSKIQIDDGVEGTCWDNGTFGNFWGDYNGTDGNGDGIWDTPHVVIGYKWDQEVDGFVSFVSSRDNYPLMVWFGADDETIVAASPSIPELSVVAVIPSIVSLGLLIVYWRRKNSHE